jgi:DNA-binding response OmpR family regulator
MRILVVEDESKVASALQKGLREEHYDVDVAATGEEGFFKLNDEVFDLVILDLGLPGRDGIDILCTMRKRGLETPVLVLTARDAVEDRVRGLDCGADDYVVKPFAFSELLARIRALLRRGRTDTVLKLQAADLEIDMVTRKVVRGGRILDLTLREFDLLEYLMRHKGYTISREMLARDIWKVEPGLIPLDNVIDVQMSRLRKKVDQEFDEKLIRTIRGVGFLLQEEAV